MNVSFPYPVLVKASVPRLDGLRHGNFTNIDNETFATPAMNGFWRLDIELLALTMQSQLALSAFHTAMSAAGATCVVPVCVHWRPNDATGRPLAQNSVAPEYTFDHVGFAGEQFEGFKLRAAAAHRDSYIDVTKPKLSQLWPGHYITLGDKLHQVVNVSAIGESETAIRVSVMPNIRGSHATGEVVVVDKPRIKCRMESGNPIGFGVERFKSSLISFIEAF